MGAVIGSLDCKEEYVRKKIDNWVRDTEQLADIAQDEPQAALSAFTKALCMRWSFVQRTISGISHLFEPLEEAIVGRKVSNIERKILALPVRFGGICVLNTVKIADIEHESPVKITLNLKRMSLI